MLSSDSIILIPVYSFLSAFLTDQPLNQGIFGLASNILSPCQPEMGTNGTVSGLYPIFLMYAETSFFISLKRSLK